MINIRSYYIIFILTGFILLLIYVPSILKPQRERNIERRNKWSFSGVVDSIYYDKNNHNSIVILFETNKKLYSLPYSCYHKIQTGDSLHKESNTMEFSVHRNGLLKFKVDLNVPESEYMYDSKYPPPNIHGGRGRSNK